MDRPYVFCHMAISLDGKIGGNYMDTEEAERAGEIFYDIAFGENPYYKHQGWLSGRVTTDDNFTNYKKPKLDENHKEVPPGDYIGKKADIYYVSVDPSGKLGWESEELIYNTTHAHVIEILTDKANDSYKAFLKEKGISYLICGGQELDYELCLKKLKEKFGIETLMLGGGAILNWSFIQKGLCDELSLVVTNSADGSRGSQALFSQVDGLSTDEPVGFEFKGLDIDKSGTLWLRYMVKNRRI